jgi:hypothetical protein
VRLLVFVLLCLASCGLAHTDFSEWKDSVRIFINTTASGANEPKSVNDFPLLIRLDSTNFNFSKATSSPGDIRFSDADGEDLPSQVAGWDPSFYKAAEVWVRVPVVEGNSSADFVTMHWNNPNATGGNDFRVLGGSVFDSTDGFVGVWHLEEIAGGVSDKAIIKDASPFSNHGRDSVSDPSGAGVVGRSNQFNGKTDYIRVPNSASINLNGTMTISAWIKPTGFKGYGAGGEPSQVNPIVRKGDINPNSFQLCIASGYLAMQLQGGDDEGVKSLKELELSKWTHVVGMWDGATVKLFVNGTLSVDKAYPKPTPIIKDTRDLFIGGRTSDATPSSLDLFQGNLDEIQLSRKARTNEWIHLSFESQKTGAKILKFVSTPKAPVVVVAEDYSQWKYSRKLILDNTVNGGNVVFSVNQFPLLIRLSAKNFVFSEALPMGEDIRFSDSDGTVLPFSFERWDNINFQAEIWVKVPTVSGSSKTDFITMHWGKPGALPMHKSAQVFDTSNAFAGVWHLSQGVPGTGTKAIYTDAVGINPGDDFVAKDFSAGLIGLGQQFEGISDYIAIPFAPSLAISDRLTISAWIKGSAFDLNGTQSNTILRKGSLNPAGYQLRIDKEHLGFVLDGISYDGSTKLKIDQWYHVAATWKNDRVKIYLNGENELDINIGPHVLLPDTRPLYIGGRIPENTAGDQFQGFIDEVQFAKSEQSSDWIKLAYQNQKPDSRLVVFDGLKDTVIVNPDTLRTDTVKSNTTLSLLPGQEHIHNGIIKLINYSEDLGTVKIKFQSGLDMGARGVANGTEIISVQPFLVGSSMAPVSLEKSAGGLGNQSLFRIMVGKDGNGLVYNMGTGAGSWLITESGDYFLGQDTVTPKLQVIGMGINSSDSSWIDVLPEDNVDNLILTASVTGAGGGFNGVSQSAKAGVPVRFFFKGDNGFAALKVSFRLWDGTLQQIYPSGSNGYFPLPRGMAKVQAPIKLKSGLAWNFVGLPIKAHQAWRMSDLASGQEVFGAVWKNVFNGPTRGNYVLFKGTDSLPTSKGLWLASRKPISSINLGDGQTATPNLAGIYQIDLIKGWNQVASPTLETMPWPISHRDTMAEDRSQVKGLQDIDSVSGAYVDADSLRPWRGYFVYSRVDTTVELRLPAKTGSAKLNAQSMSDFVPVQILIEPVQNANGGSGLSAPVRLGAALYAKDAVGLEDAFMAPAPQGRKELSAVRSGIGLRSDLVNYREGAGYLWKLAWTDPEGGSSLTGRMRLVGLRLPAGMALWVASPLRKVAERVDIGAILEVLGDGTDTLIVWAGTSTWQGYGPIPGLRAKPVIRSTRWSSASGKLSLAIPSATGIKVALWDPAGNRLGALQKPLLPAGYYEYDFPACRGYTGLMLITVDFLGGDRPGRIRIKSTSP